MIGWIYRMIVGRFTRCDHKFEIHEERDVVTQFLGTRQEYRMYTLRCSKCGEMKIFEAKP